MEICRRGHERTADNTKYYKNGTRYCVPCRRMTSVEYKPQNAENMRRRNKKARNEAHEAYGSKCVCCGESTPEFLHLDHKNNDGAQHRKEIGGSGAAILRWAKKNGWPERLQLLCYNCGMAKAHYGVCPHED